MFIVLEGIDGCGKSTHARLLADWLRGKGKDVLLSAEPTDGPIGKLVREVLSGKIELHPRTLALLFTADRMEHVLQIRAAKEEGWFVVCERYYYSTVAYQSAQGVERDWLLGINKYALKPDLVIFLDVDPATGATRTSTGEIFEKEDFLRKVLTEYKKFRKMTTVDSSRPQDVVQADIRGIVEKLL